MHGVIYPLDGAAGRFRSTPYIPSHFWSLDPSPTRCIFSASRCSVSRRIISSVSTEPGAPTLLDHLNPFPFYRELFTLLRDSLSLFLEVNPEFCNFPLPHSARAAKAS